jgi:hypothetical protein
MPASPSLLIVPARFKTGKLYTQIATTSAGVVLASSGDFNVTRATTATRFNSAGLIESVASGVPRLDYYTSGGTAGCPALLVEPQAQNIVAQSENLSNSIEWSQQNINVTGSAIASPNGLASGTLLVAPSGNLQHNIAKGATTSITSGTTITASCFFKAHGTNTFVQISIGAMSFSPASPFANFNLSGNGAITTGTYSSAFIQNYGNGWYRCGLNVTAAANGTGNIAIVPIIASGTARNPLFPGDGVNGVYAWGAQIEEGSIATSYIPTTTAAVTRNADVINLSGAVSGCIGQTEGTIYAEVDVRNFTNGNRIVCLSDGTSDNRIIIQEGANSTLQAIVTNATSGVVDISTASGRTAGIYKIAIGYKQDDFAVYVNGSQTGTDNTGGVPACNQIFIGKIETTATTNQFNDRIRAVALYTSRLTNAELAALTT